MARSFLSTAVVGERSSPSCVRGARLQSRAAESASRPACRLVGVGLDHSSHRRSLAVSPSTGVAPAGDGSAARRHACARRVRCRRPDSPPYVAEFGAEFGAELIRRRRAILGSRRCPDPILLLSEPSHPPRVTLPDPGESFDEPTYTPSPAPAPDSAGQSLLESAFQPSIAWVNGGQHLAVIAHCRAAASAGRTASRSSPSRRSRSVWAAVLRPGSLHRGHGQARHRGGGCRRRSHQGSHRWPASRATR